jgi:3-oxoacyl-[acyl-carrier-protein] synthase-1
MTKLYIHNASAITAAGHDVFHALASLRVGIDRFKEVPFWGEAGLDLQAAPIEGYAEAIGGIYRYEALAIKALRPCLENLSTSGQQRIIIYLGLPSPNRPGVPDELSNTLVQKMVSRLEGINVVIQPVPLGRTSVFYSLKKAQEVIKQGKFDTIIVGGVDTLLNANSLKGLSEAGLLKEEWDGLIPGEAAAFLQVSSNPGVGVWGRPAVAIAGIGTATETADGTADNPLIGKGVYAAFKEAMKSAGMPESEINLCINDINGARAAFEDEAYGQIRFFRTPREQGHLEVWHPASFLGETGAAVGAIELIWGSTALELGFAPGPGILASTSDAQLRAAAYLRYDQPAHRDQSQFKVRIGTGSPILHLEQQEDNGSNKDDPGLHLADVDNLHRQLAQENFDELSWLISMREHHHLESGDPWADIEEFEERVVAHLDALAWSGNLARELAIEFLSSEEMEEVAAATMVLLSVPLDKPRWDLLLETSEKSDEYAQAMISVLPHLPKETAEPLLLYLAYRGTFQTRSEAMHALAIAGWVTEELINRLVIEATPELFISIIEAAGIAGCSQLWNVIEPYIQSQARQLTGVGLCAAMAICPRNTRLPAYNYADLPIEEPITCALVSLRDGRSFLGQLQDIISVTPQMIEAIGWAGESGVSSYLIDILMSGEDEHKTAAANALYRIYGCELREEVMILVSEPEDEEEVLEIERLSQDPSAWQEALQVFEHKLRGNAHMRHGQPWTKQSALWHLQRPECDYEERLIAAWEYAVVNRKPLPLHPLQFIDKQKAVLLNLLGS